MSGGNGSLCASCDLPNRVADVEGAVRTAQSDAMATLSEMRQRDSDSFARDRNMHTAIAEIQQTVNRILRIVLDLK